MAACIKPIILKLTFFRPKPYWGGVLVLGLLLWVYAIALSALFSASDELPWFSLLQDAYFQQILAFSAGQALLSALLSVGFGLLFARAFFYQSFLGKSLLLRLFSLTFVLPAILVIFGLLGIYGSSGWLAKFSQWFGMDWGPNIYGLTGILLAHLFFNIPLAIRLFLQSLQAIPNQQRQLAAQLNLRGWQFIRLIEWPYFRAQMMPALVLIFMLCFTSFAIVLTLGGGPKFSTLEVAIYQALVFDFDLSKAGFLAMAQFLLCFLLFMLASLFSPMPESSVHSQKYWLTAPKRASKIFQVFLLGLLSLFLLLPLFHILSAVFFSDAVWQAWHNAQLWRAIGYSLTLAPTSATLALIMASSILLLVRRLNWHYQQKIAHILLNAGMLVLSVPTLVLAMGLFLQLQQIEFSHYHLFAIVVLCNAFSALPFVLRILVNPMNYNMQYYEKLCQSLHITGWQRLRLIEWHNLAKPMKYAFALACCLSLGDFTAIALFGSQDFSSLPYLLYEQLGSYRGNQASVTALVLLGFCFAVFGFAERHKPIKDNND